MIFGLLYFLICWAIFGSILWMIWYEGEDSELGDLLRVLVMSFAPLLNLVVFMLVFTEFVGKHIRFNWGWVVIKGRKK